MGVVCDHQESTDPRREGVCVRCGRLITGRWRRDLGRERELLERVVSDPSSVEGLVAMAQRRAGSGAVRSLRTRNFFREICEELSDAANYFAWWDDQCVINGQSGLSSQQLAALHHVAMAWHWLHTVGDDDW